MFLVNPVKLLQVVPPPEEVEEAKEDDPHLREMMESWKYEEVKIMHNHHEVLRINANIGGQEKNSISAHRPSKKKAKKKKKSSQAA